MSAATTAEYQTDEAFAKSLDAADPLRSYREKFHIPLTDAGEPAIYFCGNSLGLQPKKAREYVEEELDAWRDLAVDAHFKKPPHLPSWYAYHEVFRETGARLVGARPGAGEVVMMNSLTVNLHLLMVSFFRPGSEPSRRGGSATSLRSSDQASMGGRRTKILMESPAFPSDTYAVKTHLLSRELDPKEHLILAKPRAGAHAIAMEDIEAILEERGEEIALVLIGGVNFFTGQVFDMRRITAAAHERGCVVGFDLAHAAGNVPLQLHDWNVDFAGWCSYKYLNSGPGAIAGAFVHERHAANTNLNELPRYAGWWGNDPKRRFRMHLEPEFEPVASVESWQVSNPPILAMAPLRASLEIFDEVGMGALREKSRCLTGYLRWLLERERGSFEIITPPDIDENHGQGCQLSMLVHDRPRERFEALERAGVVADFREPNVIRIAPAPLYNTYHEVWRFAKTVASL